MEEEVRSSSLDTNNEIIAILYTFVWELLAQLPRYISDEPLQQLRAFNCGLTNQRFFFFFLYLVCLFL